MDFYQLYPTKFRDSVYLSNVFYTGGYKKAGEKYFLLKYMAIHLYKFDALSRFGLQAIYATDIPLHDLLRLCCYATENTNLRFTVDSSKTKKNSYAIYIEYRFKLSVHIVILH